MTSLFMVAFALIAFGVNASAQQQVYVVTGQQQFGVVDLGTGVFHQIGPNTPEGQANLVWGPDGNLLSLTYSGNLESINPTTGATKVIGPTGLSFNAFDLAEVNGKLYATDFSNNLYSVDMMSGAATLIGPTGMPPDPSIPFTVNQDGTVNLCDESLYGVNGKLYATFDSFTVDPVTLAITPVVSPNLYVINPATGVATLIGPTMLQVGATVQVNDKYYAFVLGFSGFTEFGPQGSSQLFTLDRQNGETEFKLNVDPSAGVIFGAAPVHGWRW
jgi:hypothetical protein